MREARDACARRRHRCPRDAIRRTSPPGSSAKTAVASAVTASSSVAASSRASRSGNTAASTSRRTSASSASAGEPTYSPVPGGCAAAIATLHLFEIARGAERLEDLRRVFDSGDRRSTSRRPSRRGARARAG